MNSEYSDYILIKVYRKQQTINYISIATFKLSIDHTKPTPNNQMEYSISEQ